MLRLTVLLVAAIYVTLAVFGRPTGPGIEVTRGPDLLPNALFGVTPATADTASAADPVSAAEAVEIALAAGETPAAATAGEAPAETLALAPAEQDAPVWYVTGTRVNFRAGPSTADPVVGQFAFGDAAEVLSGTAERWVRVRSAEGREGFIAARFLSPEAPRG